MSRKAFAGARIFDGAKWHDNALLVVADGRVEGLAAADSPIDAERISVPGTAIVPGFLDLQVNGGGGHLLNENPSLEGLTGICAAFFQFGTTACLPTLITDTPDQTERVIAAAREALSASVPGFLGLHLEGPHLSVARKGAHDPALIRPMSEADLTRLVDAAGFLPNLVVTVAAETVPPEQIARLCAAGITVSIGHSDAGYAQVAAAVAAGASMVTHLFNAQSQIGNREPGVVGAALDLSSVSAGIIADGIHVHPISMDVALHAKQGPGRIFLVTDAMSITGTDWSEFELTGRTVYRKDGALRLADGTLAGADLTMIDAVRFVQSVLKRPLDEALRMASLYPAEALGIASEYGHLQRGARADFVVLDAELNVAQTWVGGQRRYG